ncbi:MAG: hypothetical protein AB1498_03695 [bacterium]
MRGIKRPLITEVEPRITSENLFGREEDLGKMLKKIKDKSFCVVGISGVGKSKLISAFFEKIAPEFATFRI